MTTRRDYVFDLEGDGLLRECTKIWCGVFVNTRTNETRTFKPHEIPKMLEFMDTCTTLIAHNGLGYDFPVLKKLYGYEYHGTKVDTLVMSRLMYPNIGRPVGCRSGPHSVDAWGIRLGRSKPEHEDWTQYSEHMLHRCSEDTQIQLLLYRKLATKMRTEGWPMLTMKRTFKLFEVFQEQEEYGWLFNKDLAEKHINTLTRWVDRIDDVLEPFMPLRLEVLEAKIPREPNYKWLSRIFLKNGAYSDNTLKTYPEAHPTNNRMVLGPFSRIKYRLTKTSSDAEVKDYLLAQGWVPKEWNYKKDSNKRDIKDERGRKIRSSPKLNGEDPFIGVNGRVGTLLARRVKCVHRRSVLEGLVRDRRPDGRLSQVITGIAATGRLKHSGIVNMPGKDSFFGAQMRSCFTTKDDYVLIGTDAKSCQDRMLAARANNPDFTAMLLNGDKRLGTDGHTLARDAINEVLKDFKLTYIARNIAKNINYGWKFGASDNKLASMVHGSKDAGTAVRAALQDVFPAQAELIESLTREWRMTARTRANDWGRLEFYNGTIRGLDGRPIHIPSEHQILVYMLQSDEAITMQLATVLLHEWCTDRGWKHGDLWGFVANVHDEYQAEVHNSIAKEFAELAELSISTAGDMLGLAVPQAGESAIGKTWLDTH